MVNMPFSLPPFRWVGLVGILHCGCSSLPSPFRHGQWWWWWWAWVGTVSPYHLLAATLGDGVDLMPFPHPFRWSGSVNMSVWVSAVPFYLPNYCYHHHHHPHLPPPWVVVDGVGVVGSLWWTVSDRGRQGRWDKWSGEWEWVEAVVPG